MVGRSQRAKPPSSAVTQSLRTPRSAASPIGTRSDNLGVRADQQNGTQYSSLMGTRRTVSVEIDTGTVAIAELAATHHGMPVAEWIAQAARREFARISPGPNYVKLIDAEMVAEDAERAADEAAIAAEATRFRAAG